MKLENNAFLVTGGNSGLGAACVRRFRDAGAYVVVADIHVDVPGAADWKQDEGIQIVWADVTAEDSVREAIAVAVARFGQLRGVVNCAGILGAARVVGREGPHDLGLFARVIQVNLIGTFNVIRLAAMAMSNNEADAGGERGVIINTSSVAAFEGQIGQAAYAASKGGVASLTLPLARELARFGIRVVAIAPGVFHTPMMQAAPQPVIESLEAQTVFPPRLGDPSEFAALAQHIVENPMLNGAVLRLDGAVRMGPK